MANQIHEEAFRLRRVYGHFATGVAVITATSEGVANGLTANAVASISIEPPLVMVSVAHSSNTHALIERAGQFAINILAEGQEEIARRFADNTPGKFANIGSRPAPGAGAPILDGVLAHLECRVYDSLSHGDHTIFIGEVLNSSHADPDRRPLIFFRSRYVRLEAAEDEPAHSPRGPEPTVSF